MQSVILLLRIIHSPEFIRLYDCFFVKKIVSISFLNVEEVFMSQLDQLFDNQFKSKYHQTLSAESLNSDHVERLLQLNTNNIPPMINKINLYAEHMINGRWKYNGDSIRVSKSGVLLDGQNRLLASQKAKVHLVCDLVVGLEDDVFNTIDQGRQRVKSDLVARDIGGEFSSTKAKLLTAAVTKIIKHRNFLAQSTGSGRDGKFLNKFTPESVITYINQNPQILEQLEYIKEKFSFRCNLPRSTLLYIYHVGSEWDEDFTKKFLKKAINGVGLQEGETLHLLHLYLNEIKAKSVRHTASEVDRMLIKVWNKVGEKGLRAITSRSKLMQKKSEDYVQFVAPTEIGLIKMCNG